MMLLHAGQSIAPHDLWSSWSFEPAAVGLIVVSAALYAKGASEMTRRATRSACRLRMHHMSFAAGIACMIVALVSPLHRLGSVLFSAHMIQHELMMTIAAPLLVLGYPGVPMLWGLPSTMRKKIGGALHNSLFAATWRVVSAPVGAWLIHGAAIWIWHAPRLYDASVTNEAVHTLQHLSFMLTALLFWWSLLHGIRGNEKSGLAIVLLFTTAVHTSLLGALLSFVDRPIYSAYTPESTALWGIDPVSDQQLGGIIMWVPGSIAYVAAALFIFLKWIRASGARTVQRESLGGFARASSAAGTVTAVIVAAMLLGCSTNNDQAAAELTGGNPGKGHDAIRRYGCQSCHSIPGVTGAVALVGPPLSGIANRAYIAGVLPNSPENMIKWIRNPPAVDDKTAMPNMGVTEKDARNIAAYLYTLR